MKIAILQVEQVEHNVLEHVQESILKILPKTSCIVLKDFMALPEESYNSQRRQYHSSFVLLLIREYLKRTDADKILGVTTEDLYVPQLHFVFGEAEFSGKAAIVSLCRLKPEFYGESANQTLFLERALKESVHEIGHTYGLTHCHNSSCVMSFSNSIDAVDTKKAEFCPRCSERLLKLVH